MIRNANRTRQPEDSIPLRLTVMAAVMTGALALAVEGAISAGTLVVLFILLPFGYWISYVRRGKDNWFIKIGLTVFALFALIRFFGQLRGIVSLDEVRFPLADLFLWVQVLHGFDLPARKDLNFSLGSSLTLMAAAGSLSQNMTYAVLLGFYGIFAIAALILIHRSELEEEAVASVGPKKRSRRFGGPPPATGDLARAFAATAAAGILLFLVIPQPSGIRTFALPFELGGGFGGFPTEGGIANPGFDGQAAGSRASGNAFYGFNDRLDLRVRGELNDGLVMRVRSSAPAMWKGVLFDSYDGSSWTTVGADEAVPLGSAPPYAYPPLLRSLGPRATVSQTFYVEAEQPNVVFAAGQPDTVWFDGPVSIDSLGGLRTAATLTPGSVYSVVSTRGAANPDQLRALEPAVNIPDNVQQFMSLPASVPQRVGDLAQRITAGATNDYDRVKAIENWLDENYLYSINSPVPPQGRDAVDHFLFDTNVGFCEQFASATAVMLRSLGIPARLVAGYTPGSHNPFTGYYEVHNSDAHTWVEAWFPRYGWYEFDPTFGIPPAAEDLASNVPLARLVGAIADKLSDLGALGDALKGALAVAMVATLGVGAWLARKKLRPAATPAEAPALAPGPVTRAFRRFEEAVAARGSPRKPPETAAELIRRAGGRGRPAAGEALRTFERERYGADEPSDEEARAAVEELERLASENGGSSIAGVHRSK
jgi:transglutaminase-like putative cysteine protease